MEFDIKVSSNLPVYFSSCLVRLSYNTSAFGTNVVSNNNVIITRGSAYDNSTYTDPNADKIEVTSSVIGIPLGENSSQTSFNRTLLSPFPEILMHIKMKIANNGCGNSANIDFSDISLTSIFSYYTMTPYAAITDGVSFDNTTYGSGIFENTCVPTISNFTNNVPAGNGSILTITGKNFGASKGTGTVIFKNADKGNIYPILFNTVDSLIGIDDYDAISWTDNEIVIKLPSYLENVTLDGTNPVPGSGLFKVKNFTASEIETSSPIIIPYALYQGIDILPIYQKPNIYLSNQNDLGGYTIRCNSQMQSTFPNSKQVLNRAIKDWNCATLVNWRLGNDTTLLGAKDGICSIYPVSLSGSALMVTTCEITVCNSSSPRKFYLKSFDIGINTNYNWQIDTSGAMQSGKYDFYHAIAHELGHGLLLFHANQQGQIMYYNANIGPYPESQRVMVWNSTGAIDGGFFETQYFSSSIPACTNGHDVFSAPQNCSGLFVNNNTINDADISCFPNPIENGNLTLQLDLKKNTYVYFKVYSSMGQMIKSSNPEYQSNRVMYSIPTDDLKSGFYFIQVFLNNKVKTIKWIKL